jgi:hypothetical protein
MTTTGELLSIIEKLELVDIGEATDYLDEDNQIGTVTEREDYEQESMELSSPAPDFCHEQETA